MKFSINRTVFSKTLNEVAHITPTKTTLPITANVCISTENGKIRLTATNLEVLITSLIEGTVEQEGIITTPAKLLAETVANLSGDIVTLETIKGKLSVTCGMALTDLPTQDAQGFPPIPKVEGTPFTIATNDLATALKLTSFCASKYNDNQVLTGINMVSKDKKLTFASADGYCLGFYNIPCKNSSDFNIIIPSSTIGHINSLLSGKEDINITIGENSILLQLGNTTIISLLMAGVFPNFMRVVPASFENTMAIKRSELLSAIKAANAIIDTASIVHVFLHLTEGNNLRLTSTTAESKHENTIPADIAGKDNKIALNKNHLISFLSACESEEIVMKSSTPNTPCLLKPKDSDDYTFITMPIVGAATSN